MYEGTTTDQVAVEVRDDLRRHRHKREATQDPAQELVTKLCRQLSDIPEAHIAAVLLWVGRMLGRTQYQLRRQRGMTDELVGKYLPATVSAAGEHIHSRDQMRQTKAATATVAADGSPGSGQHPHCPLGCTFHSHRRDDGCQRCAATCGRPLADSDIGAADIDGRPGTVLGEPPGASPRPEP